MKPNPALEELLDKVAKVIAHPHTTITEHDRERAAKVFLTFDPYLEPYLPCTYPELDFKGYGDDVIKQLERKKRKK